MSQERRPPWEMTEEEETWASGVTIHSDRYGEVNSPYFHPTNDADYWNEIKRCINEGSAQPVTTPSGDWSWVFVHPERNLVRIANRQQQERLDEVRELHERGVRDDELTPEQRLALEQQTGGDV